MTITTVELRDALYRRTVREIGKRKKSVTTKALSPLFSGSSRSMFGSDPWLRDVDMSDPGDMNDREV